MAKKSKTKQSKCVCPAGFGGINARVMPRDSTCTPRAHACLSEHSFTAARALSDMSAALSLLRRGASVRASSTLRRVDAVAPTGGVSPLWLVNRAAGVPMAPLAPPPTGSRPYRAQLRLAPLLMYAGGAASVGLVLWWWLPTDYITVLRAYLAPAFSTTEAAASAATTATTVTSVSVAASPIAVPNEVSVQSFPEKLTAESPPPPPQPSVKTWAEWLGWASPRSSG